MKNFLFNLAFAFGVVAFITAILAGIAVIYHYSPLVAVIIGFLICVAMLAVYWSLFD